MSRSRENRKKQLHKRLVLSGLIILAGAVLICMGIKVCKEDRITTETGTDKGNKEWVGAPDLQVCLLDVNKYSRPGIPLKKINGIVVHYVGNPGSTAMNNRNYFQALKDVQERYASSHFVIGMEGEIVQCIPTTEIAYASNNRNDDTISIECCHPDDTGKFTDDTYDSLVQLTGWLCVRSGLTSEDVIRHYDVTGKICPKYFVENEDEWLHFRRDVEKKIEEIRKMRE